MKVYEPLYQGSAEVLIQAPPQEVYELVSNLKRMGEWSPVCYRCEWLGGAKDAVVDARFKGWNRRGLMKWDTTCKIIVAEPGRELAWDVVGTDDRVITRWRYRFEVRDGGTKLIESFEVLHQPLLIKLVTLLFSGGQRRNTATVQDGMCQTLEHIKTAVEAQV